MGKRTLRLVTGAIMLASALSAQTVDIVIATYGAGRLHDVTGAVRSALSAGRRDIAVTLDALGVTDPAPGRVKSLRVIYRVGDALFETEARDFETLALPVGPPQAAQSNPQPAPTASTSNVQPTTGGFFDPPGTASGTATPGPSSASSPAPSAPPVVSPVASVPNGACFYLQANYGGSPYCFSIGSATASLGNQRRRFRSMRLVGSGKAAVLFDADNFVGASIRVTKNQPDLRAAQGPFYSTDFEDRAASLRVE